MPTCFLLLSEKEEALFVTLQTPYFVASTNAFFAHTWSNRHLRIMKQSAKAEKTLPTTGLVFI
jgi:hypothetical protein